MPINSLEEVRRLAKQARQVTGLTGDKAPVSKQVVETTPPLYLDSGIGKVREYPLDVRPVRPMFRTNNLHEYNLHHKPISWEECSSMPRWLCDRHGKHRIIIGAYKFYQDNVPFWRLKMSCCSRMDKGDTIVLASRLDL